MSYPVPYHGALNIPCSHFVEGSCRSCAWLSVPYAQEIQRKEQDLRTKFADLFQPSLLPTVLSPVQHFRNKAKMAVSGTVERPVLGLLLDPFRPESAVDLCDCPLYPKAFGDIFPILKDFIARAGLVPFNVAKNKGELKYLLLSQAQDSGALMLRFVLRTEAKCPLIRRELPQLLQKLPQLQVVSANIQSQKAAILEGSQEIFFTQKQFLPETFNDIPLFMRPQGFFQTNPMVAEKLYATAASWASEVLAKQTAPTVWDLFCGSGGFGLHIANALQKAGKGVQLTGVEISAAAIECAKKSGEQIGLTAQNFTALDVNAYDFSQNTTPDLIVVNPPRRGIGTQMTAFLNQLATPFVIYSSCNPQTLAKDVAQLTHYSVEQMQIFDMFPYTAHYEVLVLLRRNK